MLHIAGACRKRSRTMLAPSVSEPCRDMCHRLIGAGAFAVVAAAATASCRYGFRPSANFTCSSRMSIITKSATLFPSGMRRAPSAARVRMERSVV